MISYYCFDYFYNFYHNIYDNLNSNDNNNSNKSNDKTYVHSNIALKTVFTIHCTGISIVFQCFQVGTHLEISRC